MEKSEIWEWVVMILCVVGWWPRIFMNYDPLWYHLLIYWAAPVLLFAIFIRRYRRMRAGLAYSEQVIAAQSSGRPVGILDETPKGKKK